MEHMLQSLFVFLFIVKFSSWIEKNQNSSNIKKTLSGYLYLYGVLITGIRYEGVFLIFIACLILLYHKKIAAAFSLGIISALPIIIFGIYSVSKGSFLLPNSVLLKSQTTGVSLFSFISNILIEKLTISTNGITALATQRLLIILPLLYLVFYKKLSLNTAYKTALLILISYVVLHLSFASTGWFYRYEAYLIFCSVIIVGVIIYKYWGNVLVEIKHTKLILILLFFALSFPYILRSTAAFSKASQACINIYEQQFQMAQFVKKYYPEKAVAANDIGAISFLSGANVLDLWGLGNIDVAKSKKNNYWTASFLDSLARNHNTNVAMVYDSWINNGVLLKWEKVATWKIENNVICGDDTVSFYALDNISKELVKNNLLEYQKTLPSDIRVNYY